VTGRPLNQRFCERVEANKLLVVVEHRHKPIGRAFFSDAGVRLMRLDSELILEALKAVNDNGVAALPVHDAMIAPARDVDHRGRHERGEALKRRRRRHGDNVAGPKGRG